MVLELQTFQSTLPVGGATVTVEGRFTIVIFQSTLPVGGATCFCATTSTAYNISIHAPRGGSDLTIQRTIFRSDYFNPRSPWGERLAQMQAEGQDMQISIHAPRGGSDSIHKLWVDFSEHFNPRSPWGERQ